MDLWADAGLLVMGLVGSCRLREIHEVLKEGSWRLARLECPCWRLVDLPKQDGWDEYSIRRLTFRKLELMGQKTDERAYLYDPLGRMLDGHDD